MMEKWRNIMTAKILLETYYKGLAKKEGWDEVLSDGFKFIGGDMINNNTAEGKTAYNEILKRFSLLFKAMRVKDMIIEDDRACVIANYDFEFPKGDKINGDVAEIWTIKNDKLDSLRIFFDTMTFINLTKK
jgi:hypothetical protein